MSPSSAAAASSPAMPSRPALADRQCVAGRQDAPSPAAQPKLPRAGTFAAAASLPRASSAANGLPRGRSFQGFRPTSTAAQAAQDGYYQRKAAKLYAAKKKAAAAAKADRDSNRPHPEKKELAASDLINITVDAKGVMIDNAPANAPNDLSAMGTRKNSRSRMTRSSSRSRPSSFRIEDKENLTSTDASGLKSHESDLDTFFTRKRSHQDLSRRKRESFNENAGSWDGSMPRRQGSRSFIEQRSKSRPAVKPEADTPKDVEKVTEPLPNRIERSDSERPRRQRIQTEQHMMTNDNHEKSVQQRVDKQQVVDESTKSVKKDTPIDIESLTTTPVKAIIKSDAQKQNVTSTSPTLSNISESGTEGDSKLTGADRDKQQTSLQSSEIGSRSSVDKSEGSASPSAKHDQKALSHGRWCDQCAGLGLHIAAMLSDLEKRRPLSDNGSDGLTSSQGSKKGWKSMVTQTVLGESKSKNSLERARLQQEIRVLRTTVDFLYKKIECLEGEAPGSKPLSPS